MPNKCGEMVKRSIQADVRPFPTAKHCAAVSQTASLTFLPFFAATKIPQNFTNLANPIINMHPNQTCSYISGGASFSVESLTK